MEARTPATSPIGTGTFVMPGYFETMRIPLAAGRYLDANDATGRLQVVVVNEALANHFFGPNGARDARQSCRPSTADSGRAPRGS